MSPLRFTLHVLRVVFFGGVLFVLFQASMHKQLNHDENMYITSGVLFYKGQLPYVDYPYFQMPVLSLVYAGVLWLAGFKLLAARAVSTVWAFGSCVALF